MSPFSEVDSEAESAQGMTQGCTAGTDLEMPKSLPLSTGSHEKVRGDADSVTGIPGWPGCCKGLCLRGQWEGAASGSVPASGRAESKKGFMLFF